MARVVQVDHVDDEPEMDTAHVRPYVRGLLRPVLAVRTLKPGQLAALVLQVLLQVVLPVEHAAAIRTREPDVPYELVREAGGLVPFANKTVEGERLVWKQKRRLHKSYRKSPRPREREEKKRKRKGTDAPKPARMTREETTQV